MYNVSVSVGSRTNAVFWEFLTIKKLVTSMLLSVYHFLLGVPGFFLFFAFIVYVMSRRERNHDLVINNVIGDHPKRGQVPLTLTLLRRTDNDRECTVYYLNASEGNCTYLHKG